MFSAIQPTSAPAITGYVDRDSRLIDRFGDQGTRVGLYGSIALIYAWFGGMKFTAYEAQGLVGLVELVEPSPLVSWFYDFLSVQGFSNFLGVVELSIGLLIAARLAGPAWSLIGGLLSAGLFAITLSFLVTTPGVVVPEVGFPAITVLPGQFLLKDVGLLAISLWIAVDSLRALRSRQA